MTIPAPIEGQTYISATNPAYSLYIEAVGHADDGYGGYSIEACWTKDRNDMGAIGLDINDDEWRAMVAEHQLILAP